VLHTRFGYTHIEYDDLLYDTPERPGYLGIYSRSYTPTVREAGWPMKAVRSVTSHVPTGRPKVDAQGQAQPLFDPRRWDLPPAEIVHRGVPTNGLPRWMHAAPDARLPIVPIPSGLLINSLVWGTACVGLHALVRFTRSRMHKDVRGFAIHSHE
jgi:hypothetical protein